MPSIQFRRHLASCLALGTLCATGSSQNPTPSPTPDQFIRQAADAISRTAPDMKPLAPARAVQTFCPRWHRLKRDCDGRMVVKSQPLQNYVHGS
jgi:hypothetical protein